MGYLKTIAGAFLAVSTAVTVIPPLYQFSQNKLVFNAVADEDTRNKCLRSEAIVVFTGGVNRIETGYELQHNALDTNPDIKLFVSADRREADVVLAGDVHQTVSLIVNHQAENTIDNANLTTKWARANDIDTICLVTDDYHIPRSVFELKSAEPDLEITPYPVHNDNHSSDEYKKGLCRIYENFATTLLGLQARAGEYCYRLRDTVSSFERNFS